MATSKTRTTAAVPSSPTEIAETEANVRTRQLYLTLAILLAAVWVAWEFLVPIAWAAVLGMAEWPLYERALKRFPNHPGWLALGFTAATALFVLGPLSFAAVTLAQESQAAIAWVQHVQQTGLPAPSWLPGIPLAGDRVAAWWQQHLSNPRGAGALLGSISGASVLGWMRSIGGEIARDTSLFAITLVIMATMLARGRHVNDRARIISRRMFGQFGEDFLERMISAVRGTVNGTIGVSVLEGTIIGIGYWIAGVPQPLLFATFTIVFALIPFGAWAAFGLATLVLLAQGHIVAAVALFAFSTVIMAVGDNFVQPAVIGNAVELPFLFAMIGALGGLAEFGLVGLFIGPVIMAALLIVSNEWIGLETAPSPPKGRRRGPIVMKRHV
ncbi:AI-2E family transporter [Sphingomonas sp. QA11]|uniref:AI-2E family transporter n=1 Tax=Sphingomonas sp. QA11 TaxID=2950605 RepID=UPI00234B0309|nr:AI-2E family transporter [Sphingomonas sp. QA11]WCM28603.1 AI-2E family transporter [Sphingomonas sp. QA11]